VKRRIVRQGGSYYIAIPPALIKRKWLENGVEVQVLDYGEDKLVLVICGGEHDKGD